MTTLTDAAVHAATSWDTPDLTALTLASFGTQLAAPDSFERGGHVVTVDRDGDSGKFGDDGLADVITATTSVFGRQTIAGQSVVAFDDPDGNILEDNPGKGVAFRDVDEFGDIEDQEDLPEANTFTAPQAAQVADLLASAATAARSDGTVDGLQRRATLKAAGMQIAALHDGDGVFGAPGTGYVAVGYQGHPVDWDAPNLAEREGLDFSLFDPDEADDLADALRGALTAAAPVKAGVPRKLDRLGLDGRIPLQPGERLTGSAGVDALRYSDFDPVLAATSGLQGPQLRVSFVHNEELREWNAGDDGNTAVLDPAGFAAFQTAMAAIPARADAQRAQYARDVIDPEMAAVDRLAARQREIRERVYSDGISDEQLAQVRELTDKADSLIRTTPTWPDYVDTHRKIAQLQQKYLRYEGDQIFSEPMTPQDRAEYDRLREEVFRIHDGDYKIARIDRLHNQIHGVAPGSRELTAEEKDEIADLNAQIQETQRWDPDAPSIDDMLFAGRIAGQWGDLRYEVHGSDSGWDDDNPTGVGTWTVSLGVIPPDAPLDFQRDDDAEARMESEDIRKVVRAFEKVFGTASAAQTAAAQRGNRFPASFLRDTRPIDPSPIRQITEEILTRGRA